jgi:uncharacterized cofD-like protein
MATRHPMLAGRAVCLGGGNGITAVARGLLDAGFSVAAVVATTDNGRSTGLARRLFDIPAPGDLRNVIAAFSADPAVRDLFDYRLETPALPELTGAAFGNLILGALAKTTGSFEAAVETARRLAGAPIAVHPVTVANADLCAELEDGSIVRGEVDVRRPNKPAIRRVFIDPPATATAAAVEAIRGADLVTLGPGSLFTSVLACLAVEGIADALAASRAVRVYLANTTTQPGQSDHLSLAAQIERVLAAANHAVDGVLIDDGAPAPQLVARHRAAGRELLRLTPDEQRRLEGRGVRVITADLAEVDAAPRALWQKEDAIRHDAGKVGAALTQLFAERSR